MKPDTKQILDLLIERSLYGLDIEAQGRLDEAMVGVDEDQLAQLQLQLEATLAVTGNASALSAEARGHEPVPAPSAALLERLEADADQFFGVAASPLASTGEAVTGRNNVRDLNPKQAANRVGDESTASRRSARTKVSSLWAGSGWAVAALLLITVLVGRPTAPPSMPSPAESRVALINDSATVNLAWSESAWEEFKGVQGDVSWNDQRQEGYLRLVGMPVNDPGRSQYQLWIVDPERDEAPVDGGVFDIPPGVDEVIVPVRAALAVEGPMAFAITREQPGGVVVSDGPLLVVASRG